MGILAGRVSFMHSSRPPRGGSSPAALPALLRASHLLGLALGSALGRLRESGATAARLFERAEESALPLRMTREAAAILGARWDKVPERHRPHYEPEQRFRILRIRSFLGLSQRETAEMFRVSTETIARWEMETTSVDGEAPRPLVARNPPVRRFADVVRAVVKTMELAGFGGNDLIARTLARAGWKLSSRTVGRIRRERWPSPPPPEAASTVPRAVRAKHPATDRGRRLAGQDRDGPPPLRALPPASGAPWGDTGRGLLRTDASASLCDPTSSRQAGRRPDGFTVSHRVSRCGADVAGLGSKSSLKGRAPRRFRSSPGVLRLSLGYYPSFRENKLEIAAELCVDPALRLGAAGRCWHGAPEGREGLAARLQRPRRERPVEKAAPHLGQGLGFVRPESSDSPRSRALLAGGDRRPLRWQHATGGGRLQQSSSAEGRGEGGGEDLGRAEP